MKIFSTSKCLLKIKAAILKKSTNQAVGFIPKDVKVESIKWPKL